MFYVGLDLGQRHDPSAIAVVEKNGAMRCGIWREWRWERRIRASWSGCGRSRDIERWRGTARWQ
jgi:hypothetical protein